MEELYGGLSNKIYLVGTAPNRMVQRVYGQKSNELVSRETEVAVMLVASEKGIGPKIISSTSEGRMEEYLDGWKSLDAKEILSDMVLFKMILARVKELHILDIERQTTCVLKDRLISWTGIARKITNEYDHVFIQLDGILEKINRISNDCSVVLCHNDLVPGNIMINSARTDVKLIDYEYAGYNFLEYELANFLAELSIDYTGNRFVEININIALMLKLVYDAFYDSNKITYKEFLKRIIFFTVCCHYLWGVWSVIKSLGSDINFDYMAHANFRFNKFLIYWK